MEEYLKILEKLKDKVLITKTKTEYALTLNERAALDYLIEKHKEQQVKIEMTYRKGKEDASLEIAQTRNKLYEENTLENIKLKKELEKKDKIIDEMAKSIAVNDSDLCQYIDETIRCKRYAGENKLTCDTCIKQYFEKKVEDK